MKVQLQNARERLAKLKRRADPRFYEPIDKFDALLERTDLDELASYANTKFATKYLQVARHFIDNLEKVHAVGLHATPPLRILDLGAGAGFFCYASSLYGHQPIALQPNQFDETPFHRLLAWFGVPASAQWIVARKPIERDLVIGDARFDRVTAWQIVFNKTEEEHWNADDYLFFLDDLRRNILRPGGRVVLRFHGSLYGPVARHSVARTNYYNALGALLEPFKVSYDFNTGIELDLFRTEAWARASAVNLPRFWLEREIGSSSADVAGDLVPYTPELADTICARLAAGETLLEICRDDMPDKRSVRRWIEKNHEGFGARIERARAASRSVASPGIPVTYTPELTDRICARLAAGETLLEIRRDADMPDKRSVRRWIEENHEGFGDRFERAREVARSLAAPVNPVACTPELADRICARLAAGETLLEICRDAGMPDKRSVRRWIEENHQGIGDRFEHAKKVRAALKLPAGNPAAGIRGTLVRLIRPIWQALHGAAPRPG